MNKRIDGQIDKVWIDWHINRWIYLLVVIIIMKIMIVGKHLCYKNVRKDVHFFKFYIFLQFFYIYFYSLNV